MRSFYFKAFDESGHKTAGKIDALDRHAALTELRGSGLRPYLLRDFAAARQALKQKKRRQKRIAVAGVVAVLGSLMLSSLMVALAGRDRALDMEDYKRMGLVEGVSGLVVAKTKLEREFALEILQIWQTFTDNAVTGIEVTKLLMVIYVSKEIGRVTANDLDSLASNSVRALQRRFRRTGCTVLVVENDRTILEASYNGMTKKMNLKAYW